MMVSPHLSYSVLILKNCNVLQVVIKTIQRLVHTPYIEDFIKYI